MEDMEHPHIIPQKLPRSPNPQNLARQSIVTEIYLLGGTDAHAFLDP